MKKRIVRIFIISAMIIDTVIIPVLTPLANITFAGEGYIPAIRHTPPLDAATNIDITIEALIEGKGTEKAEIFYRQKGDQVYKKVEMQHKSTGTYSGVITSKDLSENGIEYYIRAKDKGNEAGFDGSPDTPYFIKVKKGIIAAEAKPKDNGKKSWYQKPWVWALILGVAGGGAAAAMAGGKGGGGGGNNSGSGAPPADTGDVVGRW